MCVKSVWHNPIPHQLIPSGDSESFKSLLTTYSTSLPIENHCGAFGVKRKFDVHTGVDLYVQKGTPVFSVESGVVVNIVDFTGKNCHSNWWMDTKAVFVQGESGVVVYGEIAPHCEVGDSLVTGSLVGVVIPVLKKNKGRPTTMLHIELLKHGSSHPVTWYERKPEVLLDPTPHLLEVAKNKRIS